MTISPDILPILRCPVTQEPFVLADSGTLDAVNQAILDGKARDQLDQAVREPIEGGLMVAGGDRVYPIRDGIPTLIAEEAIGLN
ncbi:MAG: Trm112 family protein [Planctomycetota bacterium]